MKNFFEMCQLLEAPTQLAAPASNKISQNNMPNQNFNQSFKNVNSQQQPANSMMGNSQQQPGNDQQQNSKLQQILGKNYEQFVAELKDNIQDSKFLAFLQAGLQDGQVKQDDIIQFSTSSVPCTKLSPTQNEIDIEKSLLYPLQKTDPQTLVGYFSGGTFAPGGKIVTCGGGKYIIDGHHRWSQLYCMNPNAQIEILDMTAFQNPEMALKIAQIAVAATTGVIKVEKVAGQNLLKIGQQQLYDWVASNMGQNAYSAFQSLYQQQNQNQADQSAILSFAQQYIWNNVSQMQSNNQPVSPAANRSIMPQTGNPEGEFKNALEKGSVNWKQSSSNNTQTNKAALPNNLSMNMNSMQKQEWLILSGIIERG